MRWRRALGNLLTVAASTLFALALLEIVLRFMPVATAPPLVPPSAGDPIQRYAPNAHFTWSLGWDFYAVVHGRTNAQGFVADYDYDRTATTPLVAVIGDSFVEALQVPFAESVTGRLQAALGTAGRAYAFAQAGSALSQYIAYIEHAAAVYRPQKFVVVVVENDVDESMYGRRKRDGIHHLYLQANGELELKLTPPLGRNAVEDALRQSALALYLLRNVGVLQFVQQHGPIPVPDPARLVEGEQVIAWFLTALPKAARLPPRDIVIVVDANRSEIYGNAVPANLADLQHYFGQMRAKLIAEARTQGFNVVDMEPAFRAAYARDRVPFESRTDRHWNRYGHAVVAEAVRNALGTWSPFDR